MTHNRGASACAFVDQWLDAYLGGTAAVEVRARLEGHIRACSRCRRLVALAAGLDDEGIEPHDGASDLVGGVMARTSGGACARAEEWLPLLVDGDVDSDTRAILEMHLAHCEPCAQLRGVLEASREVLPSLKEMAPPAGFAEQVLAATLHAPQPVGAAEAIADLTRAFGRWWLRVLARPRASFELAYIGALLIMVLIGTNPVAAFRDVEGRASQLAGSVPVSRLTEQLPKGAAIGFAGRVMASVTGMAEAVVRDLAYRWEQVRTVITEIHAALMNAWTWITSIDLRAWADGVRTLFKPREPSPAPAKK